MRLIATADLHYNHGHSRAVAEQLIKRLNSLDRMDVLLLVGDTAVADGPHLEECLGRFRFGGPKLFVPGNHELWTKGEDSYRLVTEELPRRVRAAGWHWLPDGPFCAGTSAIVGSLGWYDYSYSCAHLGIPRRFYEHKVSPGAAEYFSQFAHLLDGDDEIPARAREIVTRWNDGKFVKLHRSDEMFLDELIQRMDEQLSALPASTYVVAAVHHVPFAQLLPPGRAGLWEFARAYLGSGRIGEMLCRHENVRHVLCGHSHFPAEANIGRIRATSIGSGYRWKTFTEIDLPD